MVSELSIFPESTPRWANVPSPSLTDTAMPASRRLHSASAPRIPVVTSPSMRTSPVSAASLPSKPPTVTRPQAARPGPRPSPSLARWNALPNSNSRPVISRAGALPGRAVCMRPRPVPGQPSSSGPGSSVAPSARATEVSASPSHASSSVRARSTVWPPTVTCAPLSGFARRSETASVTWVATVRPKRESHIFCSGSSFSIVPVASPSPIRAPCALDSLSRNVSLPSSTASSRIGTAMVFRRSPAAKVSVPEVAV